MKLIFFLVAFCLLTIRVYFNWSGKDRASRGENEANIVINSDNFSEEINYYGKIALNEDETGFKSISPGGYVKVHINDTSVRAESNLKGNIEYRVYEGSNRIVADEQIRSRIAWATKEMILWGFDSDNRMERVIQKGGAHALLVQVDSVRTDQMKQKYIARLLTIDSLSPEDQLTLIEKVGAVGSDLDKGQLLNKISLVQLQDSATNTAFFAVIAGMHSDLDQANALHRVMDQDSLAKNTDKILSIAGQMGSDLDKANIFSTLIEKGSITGPRFDSLLVLISGMGSDLDKTNLYKKLIDDKDVTELQWMGLINKAAQLGSDLDKGQLLVEIAQKMPKTEDLKTVYRAAAKSISNDMDYGRAIRALE